MSTVAPQLYASPKMTSSFLLCISFQFLMVSQPDIYIKDSALKTLCKNANNVFSVSKKYDIDPFVLTSLVYRESRWEKTQVGSSGDCGLTQVLHKYVKGVSCKDLFEPSLALEEGAKKLNIFKKYLIKKSKPPTVRKTLKCYKSGYNCGCKYCNLYADGIIDLSDKLKNIYIKNKQYIERENYVY